MKPKLVPFESYAELERGDVLYYSPLPNYRWYRGTLFHSPCRFREGPVPGIHKYGHGSWLRRFRHRGKRVEYYVFKDVEAQDLAGIKVRKRAVQIYGVTADPWEDFPRCVQKSWKAHRRTQRHRSGW